MYKQIKLTLYVAQTKTKIQQLFCFGALCTGIVSAGVVAADGQQPYGKLSKQLDIMNNIFASSLQAQGDKSLSSVKIDSLYLAGQGVVFTVKSANSFSWGHNGFSFSFSGGGVPIAPTAPVAPIAPIAPVAPNGGDVSFSFFNDSDEMAEQIESALELQREYSREFREQQRDLAYNLRDVERESRDLAYQLRNVSKEEKNALLKVQKALAKQKVELEKSRAVLAEKSKKIEKQQQINKDKKLAQRKKHYQKLTTSLVETLCTYGNSLKALPKGEHVSIVLKSAGDKVANSYQDKIFVLTKRNISACAIDKISAEKLLASTKGYQF
mgnify:CR=1 FL=1